MADLKFGADKTGSDYTFGPNAVDAITMVAPTFAGTIPAQTNEVSTVVGLDISTYWSNNPTSYAFTTGVEPAGLSISASGVISGTPTTAATAVSLQVTGTNSAGSAVSNTFTWTITADVTLPTTTGTSHVSATSTAGFISFTTTESGFYRIVVLPGGSTSPTIAEVLAGTGNLGIAPTFATLLVTATALGTYSITVPLLTPETTYNVYLALQDTSGNQALYSLSDIITTAELANSYITRLQADAYMATRLYVTKWNLASDNSKERALQMATRELDAMKWLGNRTDSTQALSWPRDNLVNYDGVYLDNASIPDFIMYATAELALSLIKEDRWEEPDSKGIKELTAGPITLKFDKFDRKTRNNPVVMNYIRDYLAVSATGGANWSILYRA